MAVKKVARVRLVPTKIYLVGQGEASRMEVRVTRREDELHRPRVCTFLPVSTDEQKNPLGSLVLTEELWQKWFGDVPADVFVPGMEMATSAAEKMVAEIPQVYYGCPLCDFRTKSAGDAAEHFIQEGARLLYYFDVIEEKESTDA